MRDALEMLLAEFEAHRLEVGLVPAREARHYGPMVRVTFSRNCGWYRRLCARHASLRRRRNTHFDTAIRRRDIARLLQRMINGRPVRSKYAHEILGYARKTLLEAA